MIICFIFGQEKLSSWPSTRSPQRGHKLCHFLPWSFHQMVPSSLWFEIKPLSGMMIWILFSKYILDPYFLANNFLIISTFSNKALQNMFRWAFPFYGSMLKKLFILPQDQFGAVNYRAYDQILLGGKSKAFERFS